MQIIENLQREGLHSTEEAMNYNACLTDDVEDVAKFYKLDLTKLEAEAKAKLKAEEDKAKAAAAEKEKVGRAVPSAQLKRKSALLVLTEMAFPVSLPQVRRWSTGCSA
jgi:hypothetical protein